MANSDTRWQLNVLVPAQWRAPMDARAAQGRLSYSDLVRIALLQAFPELHEAAA